jgi:hypothetical protein
VTTQPAPSGTLRLTINSARISPAKSIAATARTGPLVILSDRAFRDLQAELGGLEAAMAHLLRVASNVNKPLGINLETGEGTSSTAFVAPRSWSQERLKGWVGGHHEVLSEMFGACTPREDQGA